MMCAIAKFQVSGPRVYTEYHFGIIDSHAHRKRCGQVAQINFGFKKTKT